MSEPAAGGAAFSKTEQANFDFGDNHPSPQSKFHLLVALVASVLRVSTADVACASLVERRPAASHAQR